jgi:hypothetical protein
MAIHIGFTGTRFGMTLFQRHELERKLSELKKTLEECGEKNAAFHHGCCVGADIEAAEIFKRVYPDGAIVQHPPINRTLAVVNPGLETRHDKPYLERNRDIVLQSQLMFATPKEKKEQKRGGAWYTIRFARECKRKIIVIPPLP